MGKTCKITLVSLGLSALMFAGCDTPVVEEVSANLEGSLQIEQFGAMREVMREGKTDARVRLVDVVAQPGTVAVGALEGLHGEVTIVDGDVWISRVAAHGGLQVMGPEPSVTDSATLLTVAHVAKWNRTTIEAPVGGKELESVIERAARFAGCDTGKPFPFRIEGKLAKMDLHVVNGYCPIARNPAKEANQPWRWSNSEPTDAIIVGFYATDAAGTMTHHGTSIHVHAIVMIDGARLVGHVDSLIVEPGMELFVPDL